MMEFLIWEYWQALAAFTVSLYREKLSSWSEQSPGGGGGGALPEKLSGGVRPTSQNPYPVYEQNLWYSLPY